MRREVLVLICWPTVAPTNRAPALGLVALSLALNVPVLRTGRNAMKRLHTVLRVGAAVRVNGFAPAVVLAISTDYWGYQRVTVRHTANRSAHGFTDFYKRGKVADYRREQCPPRDTVSVRRGRISWPLPILAP